jgi:hypothetical protein
MKRKMEKICEMCTLSINLCWLDSCQHVFCAIHVKEVFEQKACPCCHKSVRAVYCHDGQQAVNYEDVVLLCLELSCLLKDE